MLITSCSSAVKIIIPNKYSLIMRLLKDNAVYILCSNVYLNGIINWLVS